MHMTQKADDMADAGSNRVWRWLRRRCSREGQSDASSPRLVVTRGDDCCGISDVGLVRPGNEDAFFVAPEQGLLVVADGLGGHAAGEIASALAIESVYAAVASHRAHYDPVAVLDHAFAEADDTVREHARLRPEYAGMGTTLIVGLISGNELNLAHAGDVRAYHWHDGNLMRLTQDHTAVGRALRAGLITEDQARHHPAHNQVDQAIGGISPVTPEHVRASLTLGDTLLLCSDGLWDEISHADIAAILADSAPAVELATRLVDAAIAAGGNDNITAVVYRQS
jgi:serine/threonine protein phosphatase PrpC